MAGTNWTIMMYIAADNTLANFAVESLNQIKKTFEFLKQSSQSNSSPVSVVAQFDAGEGQSIPRYVFDGNGPGQSSSQQKPDQNYSLLQNVIATIQQHSLQLYEKDPPVPAGTNMADPRVLRDFLVWAGEQAPADHYALILWGHGPELLFEDYIVPSTGKIRQSFLSPSKLAEALKDVKVENPKLNFDVIGIDACNMSTLEVAFELKDCADYLIASQEEVPDFSLPYDLLLQCFSSSAQAIEDMCKVIPLGYVTAYQDFILSRQTATDSISLSTIKLKNVKTITNPLQGLVKALKLAIQDSDKRQAIIEARANTKGFVAGLYADLGDFCDQLSSKVFASDPSLLNACDNVRQALQERNTDPCVIANEAPEDSRCNGLSIYFPYMTNVEWQVLTAPLSPMIKGILDVPNKGILDVPNKGILDVPNKNALTVVNSVGMEALREVREQKIQETELYYGDLNLCDETHWDEFIRFGWSRGLTEDAWEKVTTLNLPSQVTSDVLDIRYSAQQIALNLLSLCRKLENPGQSPPSGGGGAQAMCASPDGGTPALARTENHDLAHTMVVVNVHGNGTP